MDTILVISSPDLTPGLRGVMERVIKDVQLPLMQTRIITHLTTGCAERRGKTKVVAAVQKRDEFLKRLALELVRYKPRVIVINDWIALEYITQKGFEKKGLGLTRGSVYFINGLPAIVVDSLRTAEGGSKLRAVPHASWLLYQDFKKVKRWYLGKQQNEPLFKLVICDTLGRIEELREAAAHAILLGMDVETSGKGANAFVSCCGYAVLAANGTVTSYVIPLINPCVADFRQWTDEEFAFVLGTFRAINDSPVPKVLQNGSYDAHYYIRYRMPLRNWTVDTALAFHSIWPEIPKRIDFIASVGCDHYRYWKDEGKEDTKDDAKTGSVPKTEKGWHQYLRYNGLDCHYLIPCALYTLRLLCNLPWAMENYRQTMRQTLRPAMAMSYRGLKVNAKLQKAFELHNAEKAGLALADLHKMVATKDFNPGSNAQVATLLYDVYKAQPLKQRGAKKTKTTRQVDEKVLQIIQTQHPLLELLIEKIWECKKPENNISKYGTYANRPTASSKFRWNGLKLWHSRWLYKMNAAGTETGRYSAKSSDFWIGTQIQNPAYEVRMFVEPDSSDQLLWRADYSKADMWHTAFASEEPEMMRVVMEEAAGGLDVHCYHASRFYKIPYEKIYAGYKNKEEWVVHSTKGCRQNAKRIVYGANYLMGGYTLLLQMGIPAVRATAEAMGHSTAGWSIKNFVDFCQALISFYFSDMYPLLLPWLERQTNQVVNAGNRAVCCGDRTRLFFGNPLKDKNVQRELAAFYGQGGTGRTINRALDKIFYSKIDSHDVMVNWQLHDELGGNIKKTKLQRLHDIKAAMQVENVMHGRSFVIPVEIEIGHGWGYRMCEWDPNVSDEVMLQRADEADAKWRSKNRDLLKFAA